MRSMTDEGACQPVGFSVGGGQGLSEAVIHPSSDLAALGHLLPQGEKET